MKKLTINALSCQYNQQVVLQNLKLQVDENEIICLLGASGCGKTTLLKAIAGLLPITQGDIWLNQQNLANLPVEKRNIGFIFQDYALFPHLTVEDNIQFGLHQQSAEEKQQILQKMIHLVHLEGLEKRYPHQLSGGQQQRVAIARALACQPSLLLLDEPFSNIDTQVRHQMIDEIKQILKKQNISAIFVTHSKEEAFAFADKLAVMKAGKIVQFGATDELYLRPNCPFVAEFLGNFNYLTCRIDEQNQLHSVFGITAISEHKTLANGEILPKNKSLRWLIRPHQFNMTIDEQGNGIVLEKLFLGQYYHYLIKIADTELKIQSILCLELGQKVKVTPIKQDLVIFD
ncbi:iron(III) transport system ATP-binding protein [Bisgaardia hudsonensis]|uniref:Iron(III) transport system ATP-binding protein n=1 Tax=Bisgaardia hudsonensis TaxID=109472 RepID=A0A4R2N106_9PAST|nr:ABC transporter ATP-binding protein [Bisgaardia hudsonensis]QLB13227.1 ABC transporter [Bisgaardia hudsonensis]TCP13194.1 iron(III) transport system ATP-binding protein [Bisgaardia hudsonensis]